MSSERKQLEELASQRQTIRTAIRAARQRRNFDDERRLELGLEVLEKRIKHLEYLIQLEKLDGLPLTEREQEKLRRAVENAVKRNRKAQRTNEQP